MLACEHKKVWTVSSTAKKISHGRDWLITKTEPALLKMARSVFGEPHFLRNDAHSPLHTQECMDTHMQTYTEWGGKDIETERQKKIIKG